MSQLIASFIVVCIGLLAVYAAAQPPRPLTWPKIDYPPSQPSSTIRPPTFARIRRQVLGGSASSNPAGGADARVALTQALGTPDNNLVGQVFAAGNTQKGPVTSGATLGLNSNGNGIELTKTHTPGVRDSFMQTATANLYNDGVHNLDAKAFASQNELLASRFKFDRNGAAIDYSNINGVGATLTHSNIPGFGKQLELGGRANLWESQDRSTKVDLGATASKWLSGPLNGRSDYGANIGLTSWFG